MIKKAVYNLMRILKARTKICYLLKYVCQMYSPGNIKKYNGPELAVVRLSRLRDLRLPFFVQIIKTINNMGFRTYYTASLRDMLYFARAFDSDVSKEHNVVFANKLPMDTDSCLLVCDDEKDPLLRRKWRHVLKFEFNLAKDRKGIKDPLYVPYPDRSVGYGLKDLHASTNGQKNVRLLFSGAYRGYHNGPVSKLLRKIEREEIVRIFRNFENTVIVSSESELTKLLASDRVGMNKSFCFVDTDHYRIPHHKWYGVLARADVFLCPPGVRHPISHNAIEAMAVGTIPLINYPEWFHPHLIDGYNCFVFSTAEDLVRLFRQIINCDYSALQKIRENVLAYYQNNLVPQNFERILIDRINKQNSGITNLVMQTEITDYFCDLSGESIAIDPIKDQNQIS